METATVRVVVEFREALKKKEVDVETMSLSELLYWVMFGGGKVEAVGA
ncbi:MAG: hypothetical protein V4555_00655 [Acidobacteriota bacterium]